MDENLLNTTRKYFIIGMTEHRVLGNIFIPYIIEQRSDKSFFSITETIIENNIDHLDISLNGEERKLVKIIESYSEKQLLRIFSKEKTVKEFYNNLSSQILEKYIRPYIEKHMVSCIDLIISNNIPLYFKDKKFNTIHAEDQIIPDSTPTEPVFNFIRKSDYFQYYLSLLHGNAHLEVTNKNGMVVTNDPCYIILDNHLYYIKDIAGKKVKPFFTKQYITIPKNAEEKYLKSFVKQTIEKHNVYAEGMEIRSPELQKHVALSLETNIKGRAILVPQFHYNTICFLPNHVKIKHVLFYYDDDQVIFDIIERDFSWENEIITFITSLGLTLSEDGYFIYFSDNEADVENQFFQLVNWCNEHYDELAEKGIEIKQSNVSKNYYIGDLDINVDVSYKADWFDVYGYVKFGEYTVPFTALIHNILSGKREYALPNGEIAIIPEQWFSRYRELYEFGVPKENMLRIRKHYFSVLEHTFDLADQEYIKHMFELTNLSKSLHITMPQNINARLRAYQTKGFAWMYALKANGFGGCLADDMGLGKTLQTLTMLQYVAEHETDANHKQRAQKDKKITHRQLSLFENEHNTIQKNNAYLTSLIVMPTSLVHNWENEIRKFTPDLSIYKYVGQHRHKTTRYFHSYDIILTTYGVVRNDYEILGSFQFYYLILDESQIIKNPFSKTYRAIISLSSKYKLVLTGTPIENSLRDLWAQMHFLNPGMLGNLQTFRNTFMTPIEKQKDSNQEEKLKKIINPFILRRNKQEVAKDLPPLTKQVVFCDMSEEQSDIYEQEKSRVRNIVLENIAQQGIQKSSMVILKGLSTLRQLANHPKLLYEDYEIDSGKFDEIIRNLDNIVAENHKVLLFSSFVKHLHLFAGYLNDRNIGFVTLTGETTNRQERIQMFQEDEQYQVFLISLKAGGFGLNLTAADYVFVVDPWWNPASEDQAINRAHRIGQNKNVFVYRFISKNTIEEKIHALQSRKSDLANSFINTDNPFTDMEHKQLEELFS